MYSEFRGELQPVGDRVAPFSDGEGTNKSGSQLLAGLMKMHVLCGQPHPLTDFITGGVGTATIGVSPLSLYSLLEMMVG